MDVSYKYTTVCEVECFVGSQGGKVDIDGFFLLLIRELTSGTSYNQFSDPGQSFTFMGRGKCCGEEEG